jgi:hypothetical protein
MTTAYPERFESFYSNNPGIDWNKFMSSRKPRLPTRKNTAY